MKAVSSAITMVVLVAIALTLSITAVTYLLSVITPVERKSLEALLIKGDSYITRYEEGYILHLHLYSNVKPKLVLYAIEVASKYMKLNETNTRIVKCESGKATLMNDGLILTPGTDVWVEVILNSKSLNLGTYVNVRMYSKLGYIYQGFLTFR